MKTELLTDKELEAFRAIRNSILHKGQTPLVRELMKELRYQSPRSVSYVLEKLTAKGYISRPGRTCRSQTPRSAGNKSWLRRNPKAPDDQRYTYSRNSQRAINVID